MNCPHCGGFLYDDRRTHVDLPQDAQHCLNCGRNVVPPEIGTRPDSKVGKYKRKRRTPSHAGVMI